MNFREVPEPVANKEATIRDMLDETSAQLIETCCTLDETLKGLGVDLTWDGTEKNPATMRDAANSLVVLSSFCREATRIIRTILF